jgi:hypothetical protein
MAGTQRLMRRFCAATWLHDCWQHELATALRTLRANPAAVMLVHVLTTLYASHLGLGFNPFETAAVCRLCNSPLCRMDIWRRSGRSTAGVLPLYQ